MIILIKFAISDRSYKYPIAPRYPERQFASGDSLPQEQSLAGEAEAELI